MPAPFFDSVEHEATYTAGFRRQVEACGWRSDLSDEAILEKLLALDLERIRTASLE